MVKVTFDIQESSKILVLTVKGHAGSGDAGHDIICASCSILCYMLSQAVLFMHDEGKLRKTPKAEVKDGYAKIVCKPKEDYEYEAYHAFYMAYIGFILLSTNYPQFVDLVPLTGIPDKEIDKKESLT